MDCVSITFEFQKANSRNETVTQMALGDALLCPVRQWAAIVRQIWSYPSTSNDTPVSAVWRHERIEHIISKTMINALHAKCAAIR